jgi:hypothetical protein
MLSELLLRNRQSVIEQSEQSVKEIELDKKRQFDIETLDCKMLVGEEE